MGANQVFMKMWTMVLNQDALSLKASVVAITSPTTDLRASSEQHAKSNLWTPSGDEYGSCKSWGKQTQLSPMSVCSHLEWFQTALHPVPHKHIVLCISGNPAEEGVWGFAFVWCLLHWSFASSSVYMCVMVCMHTNWTRAIHSMIMRYCQTNWKHCKSLPFPYLLC